MSLRSLSHARTLAVTLSGVPATFVPVSGAGPFSCRALYYPGGDPDVGISALGRGSFGAERPGAAIVVRHVDCVLEPVDGDRVTLTLDGVDVVHVVRLARTDAFDSVWVCGIVPADLEDVTPAPQSVGSLAWPIYFAGLESVGLAP